MFFQILFSGIEYVFKLTNKFNNNNVSNSLVHISDIKNIEICGNINNYTKIYLYIATEKENIKSLNNEVEIIFFVKSLDAVANYLLQKRKFDANINKNNYTLLNLYTNVEDLNKAIPLLHKKYKFVLNKQYKKLLEKYKILEEYIPIIHIRKKIISFFIIDTLKKKDWKII